jgi:hypothetical protein
MSRARPFVPALGVCALAALAPTPCPAQSSPPSSGPAAVGGLAGGHGWSPSHPLALGSRLTGRTGPYTLGGVGGHLRLRPLRWIAVEAFTDHLFGSPQGALRHEHEGGVALQFPVLGARWWSVYPLVGACASLVVREPTRAGEGAVSDIQFGLRMGLGSELYLDDRWALRAQAEAIGYAGHENRAYFHWTQSLSSDVTLTGAAQATLSVQLYL